MIISRKWLVPFVIVFTSMGGLFPILNPLSDIRKDFQWLGEAHGPILLGGQPSTAAIEPMAPARAYKATGDQKKSVREQSEVWQVGVLLFQHKSMSKALDEGSIWSTIPLTNHRLRPSILRPTRVGQVEKLIVSKDLTVANWQDLHFNSFKISCVRCSNTHLPNTATARGG